MRVQVGEQLGELGLGSGCARDDGDQRGGALEPQHDVRCEQPQLLALIVGGRECARTLLLGNRPRILAADGNADELAEQRALVLEAGVDGFRGDAGLGCDRRDARALPAALLEQLSSGVEHPPACLLSLLGTTLGAVAAGLDILGHGCHSNTVSNTVILYRKEGRCDTVPRCTSPATRRFPITRMAPSLRAWCSTRSANAGARCSARSE